ncbi:MAG: sugar phosphate isomerase/epimerase [Rhizobiales bacterium]|nr:sugar phosphate isomerase/epimerase [Hyphomicrobiales bacterium]
MRLGIFAKTFAGKHPEPVLRAAAAAGFAAVQYNMACSGLPALPEAVDDDVVDAIGAAAAATGVRLCALSATYNMAHPDPAVRGRGRQSLGVLAKVAADTATPLLTLCTGSRDAEDQWRFHRDNASAEAWADMRAEMEAAVAIAEHHRVDLGIEPELANVVDSAARARRLIDEIGSPRLRIVLDPANLFETATLPEQHRVVAAAIDLLADRIVMGHAKDRTADGAFATAGTGVLDFDHYLARLAAAGFDGDLVTHGLAATEAPAVAAFLAGAMRRRGIEVAT